MVVMVVLRAIKLSPLTRKDGGSFFAFGHSLEETNGNVPTVIWQWFMPKPPHPV